jgi:hypothetical protein
MSKSAAGFSVVGLVLGLIAAQLSAGCGYAVPTSPTSLPISLLVLAIANYLFSFPIYRYRKQLGRYKEGIRPERPNPFYAVRVLILARASVLAGALFAGWHVGVIIWLVSFSVAPENLMLTSSFGLVAAVALTIGGLVSQWNCKTPPSSDSD